MKFRSGFISNSSSSNFLIYGTAIELSDIPNKTLEEYCKEEIPEEYELYSNDPEGLKELLYDCSFEIVDWLIEKIDTQQFWHLSDKLYIGRSPKECPDNIPIGEWKKSIEEEIAHIANKLYMNNIKVDWQGEC